MAEPPGRDTGHRDRFVVIGATGQLGFDLVRTFDRPGDLVGLSSRDIDIRDAARARSTLTDLRPTCVLNTAAYNLVDRAEDEPEQAFALNTEAVGTLASACQALGATFVHFSTDYVFDGRKRTPYLESDPASPLSAYGESKLAGERQALQRCERSVIFRVSGLFGVAAISGKGKGNFIETMLRLARQGKKLRVVADQVLGPSYTLDLARKVWAVLPRRAHSIYHLTSGGQTSFYDFARAALERAGLSGDLTPVTTEEFGARASRPAYSVLAHANLAALGEDDLRPWDAALAAYLAERPAPA